MLSLVFWNIKGSSNLVGKYRNMLLLLKDLWFYKTPGRVLLDKSRTGDFAGGLIVFNDYLYSQES